MTSDVIGGVNRAAVGTLLRNWRKQRRISQMELALKADSSARHISFIETGRSRPSQDLLLRLAEQLSVPVRDRNALLIAAGYAPAYPQTPLGHPAMHSLSKVLDFLLTAHEPNPALVMDGVHDIVAANRAIRILLGDTPEHLLRPPMNAIRLTLHPQGLAPRIHNLTEWRTHLLERLEQQIAMRSSPALRRLYDEVSAYPAPDGAVADAGSPHPVESHPYALPLRIEAGGRVLSLISTVTTFNTPMDVTVSELALETFLPADPETADALQALG
ncbi:helix-turn-helix domain-containing protein [Streptomyces sp. NPDC088400]|uniref:helix-turn-helix domain-containing protein n=1 Tax=Streptomyces sp. NPDC088400 TaxID=3365861 RepID=UPI00382815F3